jgi:hypothetical protein
MNYIVSSIILLAVILIIIYILSIDNNMEKFSNKLKDIFNSVKSNKLNFLSEKDNVNLLNFIKASFKYDDNVIIPKKIFYTKTENGFEINDLDIICYKYNVNSFTESPYKVNILFVPFEKDHYMSNQSLLGMHGNYKMDIISFDKITRHTNKQENEHFENKSDNKSPKVDTRVPSEKQAKKVTIDTNDIFISNTNIHSDINDTQNDILDMIPDIIHLTSEDDTTDTIALISHNLK